MKVPGVTLDYRPLNIVGPESIPDLNEIVTALETDEQVKVVVFDSAVDGFFLTHGDFLAKTGDTAPPACNNFPTCLCSRAPVVSIASIRRRAMGVGSEPALASDMRFASGEKVILSLGGGHGIGARRRSNGRAPEVLLGTFDKEAIAETKRLVDLNSLPPTRRSPPSGARQRISSRVEAL